MCRYSSTCVRNNNNSPDFGVCHFHVSVYFSYIFMYVTYRFGLCLNLIEETLYVCILLQLAIFRSFHEHQSC